MRAEGSFAVLASVPLALWLSLSASRPSSTLATLAPSVLAASASVAPPPPGPDPTGPSQYCVSRLVSPLWAMAGHKGPPDTTRTDDVKVTDKTIGETLIAPVKRELPTWDEQVELALHALSTSMELGTQAPIMGVTVATVADPIASGLSYEFEIQLRALRRGFEHALAQQSPPAYFADRGWLPWDDREAEASKRQSSASCRAEVPGIVLLRGDAGDRAALHALLLVGESPTSGLERTAMTRALRIAALIDARRPAASDGERSLRIVGPTFSGSAYSLRSALDDWARDETSPLHVEVVSGTATGSHVPRWIGKRSAPIDLNGRGVDVSFQATTVADSTAECAYFWFLNSRGDAQPRARQLETPKVLAGVARLSEAGTEFGETTAPNAGESSCAWKEDANFYFPLHVSTLRDAYEDLDRQEGPTHKDSAVARPIALDASLREPNVALDVDANVSAKTRVAEDIGLVGLLRQLARQQIRHVAIHATDVGDAIFLARRIRDVAPDVRLAFFDADALLLHTDFQREVVGSLVVTPYPFLGVSEFPPSGEHGAAALIDRFESFENGSAQGTYNAVLASRGASADQLSEYSIGSKGVLPVWIATVGRGVLSPNRVTPTADCDERLYLSRLNADAKRELCGRKNDAKARQTAWHDFKESQQERLSLSRGASLPWAWYLLFVLMVLAYVIDQCRQRATSSRFTSDDFPEKIDEEHDRQLDCAIARTKWLLYGTIRSFLFALCFAYMGIVCVLGLIARGGSVLDWSTEHVAVSALHALYFAFGVGIVGVAVVHSGWMVTRGVRRYFRRYQAFGRCVGATLMPGSIADVQDGMKPSGSAGRPRVDALDMAAEASQLAPSPPQARPDSRAPSSRRPLSERVPLALGILDPVGIVDVARTSFAQLRNLTLITLLLALALMGALVVDTQSATDAGVDGIARPALTLVALRAASLLSGVSPSAPALLCMVAIYVWAVGRMARLALAHSLSRGCPDDAEMDLVSTPLRLILYPGYSRREGSDAGFTEVERNLTNAIWRPITGRYYPWVTLALVVCPLVVFTLKPLSTLEGLAGTLYLGGGLALSAGLIGSTLIQLVQFWLAFERLLKRTMEHPLSPAFRTLPPFAQDSVDNQVSRSPDELLRWSACARLFHDLTRSAPALVPAALLAMKDGICEARERALVGFQSAGPASSSERLSVPPSDRPERDAMRAELQAALERRMVAAASRVTELLTLHWNAQAPAGASPEHTEVGAAGEPTVERDALWPLERSAATRELAWLRAAQTFVATVVTLIIHRHARQFRYFVCVTTICSLLLVCAIASYPFEPYRLLLTYVWVVTGSTVSAGLAVFVQMDRNTLLSHIAGTSPNRVTWNAAFVLRVVAWAVVPLFGVAAAQYPELAKFLAELVGPFTRALR